MLSTNAEMLDRRVPRLERVGEAQIAHDAADLRDVGRRVLRLLAGAGAPEPVRYPDKCVLVAEDLTPSDTANLDRSKVLGFCTVGGGGTSHVAILARSLDILPTNFGLEEWVESFDFGGIERPDLSASGMFDPKTKLAYWCRSVEERIQSYGKFLEEMRAYGHPLFDAENRLQFMSALDAAQTRLLIASPTIGSRHRSTETRPRTRSGS